MITDYVSLKAAVAAWLARDDLDSYIPDFIASGQRALDRALRCRGNEAREDSFALEKGKATVTLPPGLVHIRNWTLNTARPTVLHWKPPSVLGSYTPYAGAPIYYTVVGQNALLWPVPDADYTSTLIFWERFPQLSDTDLVINGGFGTDAYWTKGAGWSIAGGVASATAGQESEISQAITLAKRTMYSVSYTLTVSAGTITAKLGGATGTSRTVSGTYSEDLTVTDASKPLAFTKDDSFVGTLDNVTLKVTRNWLIDYAPEVLLHAALVQAAPFLKDDGRVPLFAAHLQSLIAMLNSDSDMGGTLVMEPAYYEPAS